MTERILRIDLTQKTYEYTPYDFAEGTAYGRGLAQKLIEENTALTTDRYDAENVIVLAPGLLVGCKAVSATRLFVATLAGKGKGIQISNTTGDMPQKLGSLNIAAVVIKGIAEVPGTIVHIDEDGVEFDSSNLDDATAPEIVDSVRNMYTGQSAVLGSTRAGDRKFSLAGFICTYPVGKPSFHCPRSSFGDIFGAKNIRAIAIDCGSFLTRDCADGDRMWSYSKALTQKIINDDVCGGALPGYGSVTLLKILKSKHTLDGLVLEDAKKLGHKPATSPIKKKREGVNYTCAPLCVVGCLNRHAAKEGEQYSSPAESEVNAAIQNCYGITDIDLTKAVQLRASELGIISTEYVTATKVYAEAAGIEHGEEHLLEWLEDIDQGTLVGRVIASRTHGVASLYGDVDLKRWLDRKAIQDENLFDVQLKSKYPKLAHLNPLELLYAQIFVLENLGFCIFTSFAILDDPECVEMMAGMFESKTGIRMTGENLIVYANECINQEKTYEEKRWKAAQRTDIPPFTKVLYRYFDQQ